MVLAMSTKKAKATAKVALKKPVKPILAEKPGTIYGYEQDVDRLTEIRAELAAIPSVADKMKEISKIEKKLREVADEKVLAEETATLVGTEKNYCVSAKTVQRVIPSMTEVRKHMGDALFMEVASVTLGDIDKYLTEEQKAKILVTTRTGSRRGELVDKG